MTRIVRGAGVLLGLALVAACAAPTTQTPANPQVAAQMSLDEAKDIIQRGKRFYVDDGVPDHEPAAWEFTTVHIVHDEFRRDGVNARLAVTCPYEAWDPYESDGDRIFTSGAHKGEPAFDVDLGSACAGWGMSLLSKAEAERVADALLRWKLSTPAERQDYLAGTRQRFAPIAESYRAASPKPVLSEEVHRLDVLAGEAIKEEHFNDAINDFEDALKLAPWWPEGHLKLALILGELHWYDEAIEHMQDVLDLVPDAPQARQWQDQVYRWQGAARGRRAKAAGPSTLAAAR